MPLYVQNGNLLNKTGTLGTSVGCCCDPPVPPPPELTCPCYCSDDTGFEFCDPFELTNLVLDNRGCTGSSEVATWERPCGDLVFGYFGTLLSYFGTTAQGYPFSRQFLKDEAVVLYENEDCRFAIHSCQKIKASYSRCMQGEVCICLNASLTISTDWYVQIFDCEQEAWVNITDDIFTTNREVAFNPGPTLGPSNNCTDCEFDNGNPPEPPADPGPCEYDITAGPCETITQLFP